MTGRVRITGGRFGGRTLRVPKSGVRPTSDKVKEAMFSALGSAVDGARVLDAFAGSGALGLEALSRGAAHTVFVEKRPDLVKALREALDSLAVEAAEVIGAPAQRVVGTRLTGFDLVLADPPYDLVLDEGWWTRLEAAVAPGGLLVLERRAATADDVGPGFEPEREKVYGDTRVTFLRRHQHATDG